MFCSGPRFSNGVSRTRSWTLPPALTRIGVRPFTGTNVPAPVLRNTLSIWYWRKSSLADAVMVTFEKWTWTNGCPCITDRKLSISKMDWKLTSNCDAKRLVRVSVKLVPTPALPVTVQVTSDVPSPIFWKVRARFASRWKAATVGRSTSLLTSVVPVRVSPVPAAETVEVTGMGTGPAPSGARTAARRSWSSVPTTPPRLATLNGPKRLSGCTYNASAVWTLSATLPPNVNGWPKASATIDGVEAVPTEQTAVVVPMPAMVTSP